MTQYHFFWGGPFSQWYPSKFTIDEVEYNCAEQYMMAEKARLFADDDAETAIMASKDPRVQKALGRLVKNFVADEWNAVARDVVYDANWAKFVQNDDLLNYLLDTVSGMYIVEASPEDKIWGIGMGANHPDINDPTKWQGTNWLGEVIMKVRQDILAGMGVH